MQDRLTSPRLDRIGQNLPSRLFPRPKIVEMGYEASVQREIATLRVLSHPCIARLVSSFRFGDGAYLVLEYASGGDLHSLISNKGSLDQDSTRFVIGEITSALASIHDLGFVYGDLKPENVLITETGHVKLTDFGGCRPLTEAAKELIRPSGKHLLKELRDGDWKERPNETGDNDEEMENVIRLSDMDEEEISGLKELQPIFRLKLSWVNLLRLQPILGLLVASCTSVFRDDHHSWIMTNMLRNKRLSLSTWTNRTSNKRRGRSAVS